MLVAAGLTFLAACSQPAETETADDFAARVGGSEQTDTDVTMTESQVEQRAAQPNAPAPAIRSGTNVTQLQQLGDIAAVDLGPRDGGCTFQANGVEMLVSGGARDSGRAAVRVGGELVMLDAKGGLGAIRRGTSFSAEGITATVAPTAGNQTSRSANLVVSDGARAKQYSGDWICA